MKQLYFLFFSILFYSNGFSQDDFFGAGNDQNVTVTSSSDDGESLATKTVDGSGLNAKEFEAARFLAQTTLGFSYDDITSLVDSDLNFTTWLDDQIAVPARQHLPLLDSIYNEALALYVSQGNDPDDYYGPWGLHYNYTWWQSAMTSNDQLRQRVALALSEIFVISMEGSDLRDFGEGLASFYDIFLNNAFGSFRVMLDEVTYHPCMGFYLSHLNNRKTNGNVHPDENFAREVMQLFTVGIHKLNIDGTELEDGNGNPIPTYDNDDITELAKVFTGLYGGADVNGGGNVDFGDGIYSISRRVPMQMYAAQHEPGSKTIIDNYTIPSGQSGDDDIEDALTHLFNHANVGPFIALRLIQRLVKSNPTPQYIARVASVFNNSGGERGNMEAVVRAIIMDDEARDCAWMLDGSAGVLREPILRFTQFARAVGHDSPEGRYWNHSFAFQNNADQIALGAPSVFNFFQPDYAPNGPITDAGQVAPEFQIFTTRTSIGYINRVNRWAVNQSLMYSWEDGDPDVTTDLTDLENLADTPEVLLTRIDKLFTVGQMTDDLRQMLRDAVTPLGGGNQNYNRARMAAYLIMISPDYNIMK